MFNITHAVGEFQESNINELKCVSVSLNVSKVEDISNSKDITVNQYLVQANASMQATAPGLIVEQTNILCSVTSQDDSRGTV